MNQPQAQVLDNRGLQPPEPMMRILEALGHLGDGDTLVAVNDREPLFLYPQLEARGYAHRTAAHPDGGYRIVIWRTDATDPTQPADSAAGLDALAAVPPLATERSAVILDVRDELRRHEEPFGRIMATVRTVPADQDLLLITTFEPIPLYEVLKRQGWTHTTTRPGPDEWHSRFSRA
jgi:uncharacterized protein (DUF2249 family)